MTRKTVVTDNFDGKDIDGDAERTYQVDVLTNTKMGKVTYFTKGTVHLRHKNYMDILGNKVKIPFQIWIKHSKKEFEESGEKGHWEEMPSVS